MARNLGMVTAYAYAVAGGYTGTEAEFEELLGNIADDLSQIENLSVTVTTLTPGSSATASYSGGVLSLGIPKGDKGDIGETPDLSIGTVTTLSAGADATATITGTAENPVLNLGLPKGADGSLASGVLASTYSTSKTYAVGDYVYYSGNLYRCTTAITTAEAWTSAHWTQIALADDVSDLKADISDIEDFLGFGGGEEEISINGYDGDNARTVAIGNSPFIYNGSIYDYTNRLISKIKLKVTTTGTISLGVIKKSNAVLGGSANLSDAKVKATVSLTATGEQAVTIPTPFTVESDEYLFIGMPTDTGIWLYGSGGDGDFLFGGMSTWRYSDSSVGVNFYTVLDKPSVDYPDLVEEVENNSEFTDIVESDYYTEADLCDGYSSDNISTSGSTTAPFMVVPKYSGWVTGVHLEIIDKGTLHIGTVKKAEVAVGESFDFSAVNVHEELFFNTLGEQSYTLKHPMRVNSDDLIVFTIRGDTATFTYRGSGADKGFYYVPLSGNVDWSGATLGVTFYGIKATIKSIYKGKTLSILGDSISTFSGYIPEGNATYYPSGTVQAVSDTWWYKLYTALGMTLNVNNSWSGSRVTTTAGETSAGCMTRCQSLGTNPDIIIVWMGINDFNNEVALGTYDGTTALPSVTTTFREAYAIMLNKILTAYQSSEVWVCTLPQCERNAESGFPEINGNGVALAEFNKAILELANAFGVKVLDHNKCGLTYQNMPTFNPDNLHPNKYGHSLVANNDIRQMDNAVRTRYSIS